MALFFQAIRRERHEDPFESSFGPPKHSTRAALAGVPFRAYAKLLCGQDVVVYLTQLALTIGRMAANEFEGNLHLAVDDASMPANSSNHPLQNENPNALQAQLRLPGALCVFIFLIFNDLHRLNPCFCERQVSTSHQTLLGQRDQRVVLALCITSWQSLGRWPGGFSSPIYRPVVRRPDPSIFAIPVIFSTTL
jgi:hypothetical protein